MAKLKAGRGALRMDLIDDDLVGTVLSASTHIRIQFGAGWYNDFYGDFQFDAQGNVVGGTLTSVTYTLDDKLVYSLTGATTDAKAFFDLVSVGQGDDARALVLSGNDQLTGSKLNDFLIAYAGNDTVSGAAGADHLEGGAGKDRLLGGNGNDVLIGGAGADKLTGGAGADTFMLLDTAESSARSTGRDSILDFSHADRDKIDLSALDANVRTSVDDRFTLVSAFTGHAGELVVGAVSGGYLVQGDVGGPKGADFSIFVASTTELVAGDFVF